MTSAMTIIGEETALDRLRIFADETNDYTIRAVQFRPDVRELLALASSSPEAVTVMREALEAGTLSQTSFDGHAVRIDFETREEANALFAALLKVTR